MKPENPGPPPGVGPGPFMPGPAQPMGMGPRPPAMPQPGSPMGRMPMPGQRLDSYYSNCVLVATGPREISVLFGRYVQQQPGTEGQGIVPTYEKEILMTVEQAEELIETLTKAVNDFKSKGK